MTDIPRAVLSEHFQERLKGRRLVSAVFLTFKFDPAFFEEEVLPVFFDIPLSHAAAIRLVQLEDALRSVRDGIAVYYDQGGLVPGAGSAKLDVRRIAIRHPTGIFHAKNVLTLVESPEPDEEGNRERSLLVSCLSANLTRSGWWENVEVCHTEELWEGDFTRLRDDLGRFLDRLEREAEGKAPGSQSALLAIREFLRGTGQREHRSTDGVLHTHFFGGRRPVAQFLREEGWGSLDGMNLEILSPYFDAGSERLPLQALLETFSPREVRILLPRNETGEALCSKEVFDWVRSMPKVRWGHLPKDLRALGKGKEVRERFVHAKVYRFFSQSPKREILFVGSANLSSAAHGGKANLETGFLVEIRPPRQPEWWLACENSNPSAFITRSEDEGADAVGGTRLSLRFSWDLQKTEAYWDAEEPSPRLTVSRAGAPLFELSDLPPRVWKELAHDISIQLESALRSTSLLWAAAEGKEPGVLLVQEEGMHRRPSLLFDLTPADILRYWSLLSVEARAAFLEARIPEGALSPDDAALVARFAPLGKVESLFDRFAGIFHAFGALERSVRQALSDGRTKEASYRLFGTKYDSLGNLLERIGQESKVGKGDPVEQYVIALSARQFVREVAKAHPEYWRGNRPEVERLELALSFSSTVREALAASGTGDLRPFLDWFDDRFLARAKPVEAQEPS